MQVGLEKGLAEEIYKHIGVFVTELLGPGRQLNDYLWCIHPGGPLIIEAITKALNIDKPKHTYEILRKYGNMSSPSIMFILEEICNDRECTYDGMVPVLAFGPGVTIEGILLKRLFHP